ncbi:hypothetical protein B0H14DRAFT_3771757 [Mycena olivaceomarginata]|nr:hypothetical protein B0H14DRAFT_3771757 [Mycena olivaceomarginata]
MPACPHPSCTQLLLNFPSTSVPTMFLVIHQPHITPTPFPNMPVTETIGMIAGAFNKSFPAGFFDIPGADTPSAATPQHDDDTHTASTASQHPGSQDPAPAFDTPFPLHAVARERPSFESAFHSTTLCIQSCPFSHSWDTRQRIYPPLCDFNSDDEDDEDDNDEPAAPNATQSDTARLLSLYKAGVVKAGG